MGMELTYPPFEMQDTSGQPDGVGVKLAEALAQDLGRPLKIVPMEFTGLIPALKSGSVDVVISSMTATDERRQSMDFTEPYFDARQLIAVRGDSTVTRFTDLKALRVAVQTGTTGDEAVTRLLGKTNDKLRRFESTPLALAELESGGVDAVVADNGVVAHYLTQHPGSRFKAVDDPTFVAEQYGLVVKKGRADLLAQLNQGLAAIRADGTLARIQVRYFGPADGKP